MTRPYVFYWYWSGHSVKIPQNRGSRIDIPVSDGVLAAGEIRGYRELESRYKRCISKGNRRTMRCTEYSVGIVEK